MPSEAQIEAAVEQAMDQALTFAQPKLVAVKKEKGLIGVWCQAFRAGWECSSRALAAAEVKPRVKHNKRGTTYEVIGTGKIQAENWWERNPNRGQATFNKFDQTVDMREVVIYRSESDGSLWVRPAEEFNDGRFSALTTEGE